MQIAVDVETNGPLPNHNSLLSIGAVVVEEGLGRTFYTTLSPLPSRHSGVVEWDMDTVAIHGFTPEMAVGFPHPQEAMNGFNDWLKGLRAPWLSMVTDTSGFDWAWVASYFGSCIGHNPFGFSGWNARQDFNSWMMGRLRETPELKRQSFGKLSSRPHTHNALDDALHLADCLLEARKLGF